MPALQFASVRIYREHHDLDPRLYEILLSLVERAWPNATVAARVTCIFRTAAEEIAAGGKSGIHTVPPPYRAVDIGAKEFTQAQIDTAAKWVNDRWSYDPYRPNLLCCFAVPHGTGLHFHLQVHRLTARKGANV